MTKISIIMPIFNSIRYIENTINSVLCQTLSDIELICIDDCSTDGTKEFLIECSKKNPQITLILHNQNMGPFAGRKEGTEIAKGKYIMFMDSDDLLYPYSCENLYHIIEKNKVDILKYNATIKKDNKNIISPGTKNNEKGFEKFSKAKYGKLTGKSIFNSFINGEINCLLWTIIAKKELIQKSYINMPKDNIVWADDWYASFFIYFYSKKYLGISEEYYIYFYGRGMTNTSGSTTISQFERYCTSAKYMGPLKKFIENNELDTETKEMMSFEGRVSLNRISELVTFWKRFTNEKDRDYAESILRRAWTNDSDRDYINSSIISEKIETDRSTLSWRTISTRATPRVRDTNTEVNKSIVTIGNNHAYKQLLTLIASLKNNVTNAELIILTAGLPNYLAKCANAGKQAHITVRSIDVSKTLSELGLGTAELQEFGEIIALCDKNLPEKYVYISPNSIVLSNIDALFDKKYDKPIAAIRKFSITDSEIHRMKTLGCEPLNYISTRMMVINIIEAQDNIIEFKKRINSLANNGEEYVNQIYIDNIIHLPGKWNSQMDYFVIDEKKVINYITEYEEIIENSAICTFPSQYMFWKNPESVISPLLWNIVRNTSAYIEYLNPEKYVPPKPVDCSIKKWCKKNGIIATIYMFKELIYQKIRSIA